MSTKEDELYKLLIEGFTLKELARFVLFGPDGKRLSQELLPPSTESQASYVADLVDLFRRRGLIDDEFFERLKDLQPQGKSDIERVKNLWLTQPGETVPLTHRPPRRKASKRTGGSPAQIFFLFPS